MDSNRSNTGLKRGLLERSELALSFALMSVLIVLLVPLPPVLLDLLLATNLALTILLLLVTLNTTRPLDISVFPSLLLLMTLYRLSLNVATTRLILLDGDAGRIVSTFGGFVVGGNLVVGLVIFLILIIIQFIVITKGAGRVSEVAARFTLDAMPGKQMAIDAELNAGTIADTDARQRRDELESEAEFYGAMDGASKFVRGDAIAGLIITAVNLLGGVVLGVSKGLSIGEAIHRYSILTVGDGLVSQIPALIIATTAGILVTKNSSKFTLGSEIGTQLFTNKKPLLIGAVILAVVSLTPGLPKIPFLLLSAGLFIFVRRQQPSRKKATPEEERRPETEVREQQQFDEFLQGDRASLEIGVRLVPLVDPKRTKGLAERIANLRRDMTRKHGIWVPTIRIRDNVQLAPDVYRILISGREVARGELRPDLLMAIDPGETKLEVKGEETTEPAFGLRATWITATQRQHAELGGFTVVDAPSVLITHVGEVLRRYAHELLSREDLQTLLDKVKTTAPNLCDEIKPEALRVGTIHQVLTLLLKEQVPITNLPRILESLINHAPQIKDPVELSDKVRVDLGRAICDRCRNGQDKVEVAVFDPRLEGLLREAISDNNLCLPPAQLEKLIVQLSEQWQLASAKGHQVAALTDATLRRPLRHAIERALPDMPVIAYPEIPTDLMIEPTTMIRVEDVVGDQVTRRAATMPDGLTGGDFAETSALGALT